MAVALGVTAMSVAGTARAETRVVTDDDSLYIATRSANPGDVIEVEGGRTYKGRLFFGRGGTPGKPVIVRGVPKDGERPVIAGGDITISIEADHFVFESLEITQGEARCVFVAGHDVILRDLVIHHCKYHGLLSADEGSGSLLVDRCEFYESGEGDRHHQIYVTSDQFKNPGSTFRLQHSYVHESNGGNSVKSRAERNEIYFNWIEGAKWHEIELIGPDVRNPPEIREDSDVVGNVFVKHNPVAHGVRIGGDGTMDTDGRFRFVNNTFVMLNGTRSAIRLFEGVESVELYNNAFFAVDGAPVILFRTDKVEWTKGKAQVIGSHNFIPDGSQNVPDQLTATIGGSSPKLVDPAGRDYRPAEGSPLIDAGAEAWPTHPDAPFPSPLTEIRFHPPIHTLGAPQPRPKRDTFDVGALEAGTAPPPSANASPLPTASTRATAAPATPSAARPTTGSKENRCMCSTIGAADDDGLGWWLVLGLAMGLRRRRGRPQGDELVTAHATAPPTARGRRRDRRGRRGSSPR